MSNEILKIENGAAILDPSTAQAIRDFEVKMKDLKAQEDELKKKILEQMETHGVIKLDTDGLTITYIAPTDRETFDSKALRKDEPDTYDRYIKMTPVKSSIRIKVK